MVKINKSNLTRLFRGFRPGIQIRYKINLQHLESCEVLTSLQHNIVQDALNMCTFTKPVLDGEGNPVKDDNGENKQELVITLTPCYIARLFAILEKPYNEAKVDHLGNPWERKEPLTGEPVKVARKGKSRKDLVNEKNT